MRAREITFLNLVQRDKEFQVPLHQRTYSWGGDQLQRLWEDVGDPGEQHLAGETAAPHFLGSVVLAPGQIQAGGVQRWLVVDGQQRLTTLMPAFAALRDHLKESGDARGVDSALRMNLEIASAQRWGKAEILARADRPAERAVELWPGPIGGVKPTGEESPGWAQLRAALVAMPGGSWTTYGDVAELIGSHPVAVGAYLGSNPTVIGA